MTVGLKTLLFKAVQSGFTSRTRLFCSDEMETFQIECVGPLAVCYTPARQRTRAIFCDPQGIASSDKLDDFFLLNTNRPPEKPFVHIEASVPPRWQQHPLFPEITLGPRSFPDGTLVFCSIRQQHELIEKRHVEENQLPDRLDFLFSTTAKDDDLWRVQASNHEDAILTLSWVSRDWGGGFVDPTQTNFGLVAEHSDLLQPIPEEPYLHLLATDTASIRRWQNQPLPFRIRPVE